VVAQLIPLQIFAGDMHGLNTLKHQPAKVAAMEGLWETTKGAPLLMFAWPDAEKRSNHAELKIPMVTSLILTHDINGEVKGLNDFKDAHPPVLQVFWAFRVMVGTGMMMLIVSWLCVYWLKRRPALAKPLAYALVTMTFAGWVATVAGWYVTEIGRQPYLVYGVLKTASAASAVPSALIAGTFAMYIALYLALIVAYVSVVFHLARSAGKATHSAPTTAPTLSLNT
jgi:cytochrome bd ubiquinol oxidase subunit I